MKDKLTHVVKSAQKKVMDNRGKIIFVGTTLVMGGLLMKTVVGQEAMFKNFLDAVDVDKTYDNWVKFGTDLA